MAELDSSVRVLGIDVGATHSRARLVVGSDVVAEVEDRSASVAAEGAAAALAALDGLLGRLPTEQWGPLDAACLGAAGMSRPSVVGQFESRLASLTRDGNILIVGDGFLVLPAANLDDGVGVVCGTGTVAVARHGERLARAGGWGYLLGDDGSGYWVVRRAIRALLDRADRGRPLGVLGADLLGALGLPGTEELRDQVYADPRPGRWAALAPVVLASEDPELGTMRQEAAEGLGALVSAVVEGVGSPSGLPVVLAGGMTADDRFCSVAVGYLGRQWPQSAVSVLREPPVAGAVRLAQLAASGRQVLGGVRYLR